MGSIKTHSPEDENTRGQEKDELLVVDNKRFYGSLEFDLGFLTSKMYGDGHIKGKIPLVLPKGVYVSPLDPSVARDNEDAYEYVVNWADKHKLKYRSKKYRNNLIKSCIHAVASNEKGGNVWVNPVCMTNVAICLFSIIADDLQEEIKQCAQYMDFSSPVDLEVASGRHTIRDIINGKYKEFSDLPPMEIPMLSPFPIVAFLIYELSTKEEMSFSSSGESKIMNHPSVKDGLYAFSITKNTKFMESCSEPMWLLIRGIDGGGITFAEWKFDRMGYKLPEDVRVTIIFKRILQSYSQALSLTNDILGLKKELEEENCSNTIFLKIKRRGLSLEAAVEELLAQLRDELSDVQVCAQKLLEDFPDSGDVRIYVENLRYAIDGHTFMYLLPGCVFRYGECKLMVTYDQK